MPVPRPSSPTRSASRPLLLLFLALGTAVAGVVAPAVSLVAAAAPDHLVVSEVVTGGASASDELVELYNPTGVALPLEGLELVYVSATGATITRRVTWPAGAPLVPAHAHVLVANDLGAFAPIADALYSGGMAATGGSVAIRIQGAGSAIDAVGWGTASSAWMEGTAAPAPATGESLERLPGGAAGSGTDTDANAADFAVRAAPDPQNLGSPPVPGSPTPTVPAPTPQPTTVPTPIPTVAATPGPSSIPIATARGLPDGSTATIEGVTLTGSDFTDGGGYLADASGAVAVLPDADAFVRGRLVRVTGEIDDRFGQRTLRVAPGGIVDLGPGADPSAVAVSTASIGEAIEGRLARIAATIVGSPSTLTTSVAFDVDDGSGPTRLVVATATGIDVSSWESGTALELVGVIGQRDSTGTGTTGYRIQPRDAADVVAVTPPAASTPAPSGGASTSPGASPSGLPEPGVMTIAAARAAPRNARVRVQGTVTLPTGVVDAQTAAVQDATGAILLRLSDEAGSLQLGARVDVSGTRSTKSGMETIRVTTAPRSLGTATDPTPRTLTTGAAAEAVEAELVIVRGGLVASARRASSGTVTMEIDDGSGPLRIVAGSSLELDRTALLEGAWIEVRGVLGQETTGSQPLRGYRVWPRTVADVRISAAATGASADGGGSGAAGGDDGSETSRPGAPVGDLGDLRGSADGAAIGATLVVGRWPELGLGGLLWDSERLVGITEADASRVSAILAGRRPPAAVELTGLRAVGAASDSETAIPRAAIGEHADAIRLGDGAPAPPSTVRPQPGEAARWFAVVGRLDGAATNPRLRTPAGLVPIDHRCADDAPLPRGLVTVSGIAAPGREVLIVPCGGVVPGSTLARAAGAAGPLPAAPDADMSALGRAAEGSVSTLGTAAAALLGAAALVLAGAAAWLRLRPDDPSPTRPGVAGDHEAGPGQDTPGAASTAAPVLTLVTLPHERSP